MSELASVKPYISLILAKIKDGVKLTPVVDSILDDLKSELGLDEEGRHINQRLSARRSGELTVGLIHYSEKRKPSWSLDPGLQDILNELILICRSNRQVGIFMSDASIKDAVRRRMTGDGSAGLSCLQAVERSILHAAFVDGAARTLWLSGTHRRASVKADNKVLTGLDLRDALDPIADQTYYFTAARCLPTSISLPVPIGVSPRKSQIWLGASASWNEFRHNTSRLLDHLEAVSQGIDDPLPILAICEDESEHAKRPYDMAFAPPELLAEPAANQERFEELERWAYHANFNPTQVEDDTLVGDLLLAGDLIGSLIFKIKPASGGILTWEVGGRPSSASTNDVHKAAMQHAKNRRWVKLWFESGHTVCEGQVYSIRHRDLPFGDIVWADFDRFDVHKEKPSNLAQIGNQDSLFDWVYHKWPIGGMSAGTGRGWLACDDGAMEIADFIHLDKQAGPPRLTLIHVKASGNREASREISVSDYEVVTSQAIKNLRYMDNLLLKKELMNKVKNQVGNLVWHDGHKKTRNEMTSALDGIGDAFDKRIVVLQPRLTKTSHDRARSSPSSAEMARLRQLDTLLLGASANCRGCGSEFFVIGDMI